MISLPIQVAAGAWVSGSNKYIVAISDPFVRMSGEKWLHGRVFTWTDTALPKS